MRRRTYDVVGRAEGRRLLETQGTHSDLAAAFLWIARTICISQESFGDFFFDPAQPGTAPDANMSSTDTDRTVDIMIAAAASPGWIS